MKKRIARKFLLWVAPYLAVILLLFLFIGGLCAAFTNNSSQGTGSTTSPDDPTGGETVSLPGNAEGLPVSNSLIEFLERWEGYSAVGYRGEDSWNITIGYGHVEAPGEVIGPLTKQQAEQLLMSDLKNGGYISSVEKAFAGIKLTQNEFDALVSMAYNLGPNIWPSLTLTKDIKEGAMPDVMEADFERLCNVGGSPSAGLLRRRKAEWVMFSQNKYMLN